MEGKEFRPLRGRVLIEVTGDNTGIQESFKRAGLIMPGYEGQEKTTRGTSLRGVILFLGPPAQTPKRRIDVEPGFRVGDEVLFLGEHKSRLLAWNGLKIRACSQEEVLCVIEP